jgi:hypothetical protein
MSRMATYHARFSVYLIPWRGTGEWAVATDMRFGGAGPAREGDYNGSADDGELLCETGKVSSKRCLDLDACLHSALYVAH